MELEYKYLIIKKYFPVQNCVVLHRPFFFALSNSFNLGYILTHETDFLRFSHLLTSVFRTYFGTTDRNETVWSTDLFLWLTNRVSKNYLSH